MGKTKQNQTAGNQTTSEALTVWGTGRQGVQDMLSKMGAEIRSVATPKVGHDFDTWTKRAFLEITNRDELKSVVATREGVFSLYKCLVKAATMGVQIGGQFPQAYFMPAEGKAVLVISAGGLGFVAAHGPGAVLRYAPELVRVYEKDLLVIDQAAGEVRKHQFNPFVDRGKLVGWYMRQMYLDGHVEIPSVTVAKVKSIIDAYSRTTTAKGDMMPAWKKSPEEMADKTAAKHLLGRPARLAEGLAMAMSAEDGDDYEQPAPDMRDVTERTADRLEHAAEGLGEGTVAETKVEPEPAAVEPAGAAQPAGAAPPDKELF